MKRLSLLLILLCLLPSMAWGMNVGIVGGGGATQFSCATSGDLLCDNFDGGATTCADDALSQTNCNTTWTRAGDCISYTVTNAATGLESGTNYAKSLTCASDAKLLSSTASFTEGSPRYAFGELNIGTLATGTTAGSNSVFIMRNTGAATGLCGLGINNVGDGTAKWIVYSNGSFQLAAATGPTQGTSYYVWIDYIKNKSDATGCSIYVSTTKTKPASPVAGPYNTANTDAGTIRTQALYATGQIRMFNAVRFDRIRVSSSAIGDDP